MRYMKKKILVILAAAFICFNTIYAQGGTKSVSTKQALKTNNKGGQFINIKDKNGTQTRVFAAGPEDAKAAILFVHDFFGISDAAKQSVERLGKSGYRTIAVDLYNGKSATTNDSANALMQAKDKNETDRILQCAIEYLKRPGRKMASVGFSAGGIDAMNANLMAPELFSATVIVYGGNYDKIEKEKLDRLKSPVLAITGSLDDWPLQAALNFLTNQKSKSLEMYVYPGADHGYAQPLFSGGKNYNPEATRVTWMLMEDFLARSLKN
jgi:carboxymethylenebutenolidase